LHDQNRDPVTKQKSLIDFHKKNGIRLCAPSDHSVPKPIFHRDPIAKEKSLIDAEIIIADRFPQKNRDPISCSASDRAQKPGFQSLTDFEIEITDRFFF